MSNTYQNRGNGYSQGRQDRNNQYSNANNLQVTLPNGYLENGYYVDPEKEKRNKDYIIKYAKQIASCLEREGNGQKNNRSQIRKYFDYALRVRDKLLSKDNDFSYVEADIAQFESTVAYAKGRGVVTDIFEKFVTNNIEKINDAKDYYAFIKHFEAVVAFMKK